MIKKTIHKTKVKSNLKKKKKDKVHCQKILNKISYDSFVACKYTFEMANYEWPSMEKDSFCPQTV